MVIETGFTIAWNDDTPYNNSEIFKLIETGGGCDGDGGADGGSDGSADGSADGGADGSTGGESMFILGLFLVCMFF